jgi:hypothetical protein
VTELTAEHSVTPGTFEALSRHYSEQEICDIVYLVGSEHVFNVTNGALNVGSDGLCESPARTCMSKKALEDGRERISAQLKCHRAWSKRYRRAATKASRKRRPDSASLGPKRAMTRSAGGSAMRRLSGGRARPARSPSRSTARPTQPAVAPLHSTRPQLQSDAGFLCRLGPVLPLEPKIRLASRSPLTARRLVLFGPQRSELKIHTEVVNVLAGHWAPWTPSGG